jgi:hypothetical protein
LFADFGNSSRVVSGAVVDHNRAPRGETLSFKVTRLTVGKGKTVSDEKAGTWTKMYFELEAQVQDQRDLNRAKATLEGLVGIWLSGATVAPKQQPSPDMNDSSQLFPERLRNLLAFEQKADCIVVKPRKFLGSENLAEIAGIVKAAGGQYISAGKDSHFEIPMKRA